MSAIATRVKITDYEPGLFMPTHSHDYSKISFVLYGNALEGSLGQESTIEPGCVLTKPCGFEHFDAVGTLGLRVLSIRATSLTDQGNDAWQQIVSRYRQIPIDPCLGRVVRSWIDGNIDTSDVIDEAVFCLAGVIRKFDKYSNDESDWCRRAINALADRLDNPPSLTELSLEIGVHPVSLSRAIRLRTGYSKTEIVHQMRIRSSLPGLASGETATIIAYDLGFSDLAHFSRVFRRWMGCSPSEYCKHFCQRANSVQVD